MPETRKRLNLVLVSSRRDCIEAMTASLQSGDVRCRLLAVAQSDQTLPYLRRDGRYRSAPKPDLVLFDAVDPGPTSLPLLKKIKAESCLRSTPVVVLTNDRSRRLVEAVKIGRVNYTTFAPVNLHSFVRALSTIRTSHFIQAIARLEHFGFVLVRMPDPVAIAGSDRAPQDAPGHDDRALPLPTRQTA